MQILLAEQIRQWDDYTIKTEPISPVDLMERASVRCFDWLMQNGYKSSSFIIYCAKGNNGGDGLCIARLLRERGLSVVVRILEFGHLGTPAFQHNLERLHKTDVDIKFISSGETIHPIEAGVVVIDALFGSGLNRPLEGLTAAVVQHINQSGNEVISIDLPTGLFADQSSLGQPIITARHTLSFQCYKLAFMLAENAPYTGEVHILEIGLHPDFLLNLRSPYQMIDRELAAAVIRPRNRFSHKGNFGHGALICGSVGMMGAAVIAAKAFLRSGGGKLTCHLPASGHLIMQTSVPEAMVKIEDGQVNLMSLSSTAQYTAVGVGPGLGIYKNYPHLLHQLFSDAKFPIVVDADALNVLSQHKELLRSIFPGSVLTPHPREFDRLFGPSANDYERIQTARKQAAEFGLVIVLKGAYTFIVTPGGAGFFNTTGNPGMAKGGTGDALTGVITSLLAQGFPPEQAAVAGVYLHGLAGDLAADHHSTYGTLASDLIEYLGVAFSHVLRQERQDEIID